MKKSRFTDSQILAVLKQAEAARREPAFCTYATSRALAGITNGSTASIESWN